MVICMCYYCSMSVVQSRVMAGKSTATQPGTTNNLWPRVSLLL